MYLNLSLCEPPNCNNNNQSQKVSCHFFPQKNWTQVKKNKITCLKKKKTLAHYILSILIKWLFTSWHILDFICYNISAFFWNSYFQPPLGYKNGENLE